MHKKNAYYPAATLVLAALFLAGPVREATAWGPHPQITRAAIQVLPDLPRWKAALGGDNLAALADYCWMPDERGMDMMAYYADDYLLIHQMPRHISHVMPDVRQTFIPYFRRALESLRTETPVNACRQVGSLVHFVEDTGAPPHAKEKCPHHSELENWVRGDLVVIKGYRPRLLGTTDAEAEAGFLRRMAGLVAFSKARAERALPLVSQANPDQAKVEPIILESALESARVTADVLYTLFTLGLAPQPQGAGLMGTVTAATMPLRDDHGARVVLLGTDYATLATTAQPRPDDSRWHGTYELRNLPPGDYRVLVYRTASQVQVSKPVHLETGRPTRLDFDLKATSPAGNVIENPDARVESLQPGVADRWTTVAAGPSPLWTSTGAYVAPHTTYRCGAILKDPAAKVQFVFAGRSSLQNKHPQPLICPLSLDGKLRGELVTTSDDQRWNVTVQVRTTRPLKEAIEKVWVVPEVEKP
jgi:hypothetical protein